MSESSHRFVYVFRHACTDWNTIERLQGHNDVPLNAEGYVQVSQMQKWPIWQDVDLIVTSDLKRAYETARSLATRHSLECLVVPQLREVYLGDAQGLTLLEVNERFGPSAWEDWCSSGFQQLRFPGGESKIEALSRVRDAWMEILRLYPQHRLAWCAHGFLMNQILRASPFNLKLKLSVKNHSPTYLRVDLAAIGAKRDREISLNSDCFV